MREFFTDNMDYIYAWYGLFFILLGGVCCAAASREQRAVRWLPLGMFGFLHGINEWLDMIAIDTHDNLILQGTRFIFMTASYFCLIEFGRINVGPGLKRRGIIELYGIVTALIATGFCFDQGLKTAGVIARYVAGFGGGLWAALACFWFAREDRQLGASALRSAKTGERRIYSLILAGAAMVLYALFTGFITPRAVIFFAPWVNYDSFLGFLGFPVQIVRMFLGMAVAISIWRYYARHILLYNKHQHVISVIFLSLMILLFIGGLFAVDYKTAAMRLPTESIGTERLESISILLLFLLFVIGFIIFLQRIQDDTFRLRAYTRQLESANKDRDKFAFVVSHDLKEPLRSLNAFSTFILREYQDKLDAVGREYLEHIKQSSSRLYKQIEAAIEVVNLDKVKLSFTNVYIKDILQEVLIGYGPLVREKNVTVAVNDPFPGIICDRTLVSRVFSNLISNAIKFNDKPDPRIEIGSCSKDGVYEFYVKDNGPGIEEKYFEKIFEIFQRLNKREDYDGIGAGLTIARKIAGMHGGALWVQSRAGEGATFYFTVARTTGKESAYVGNKDRQDSAG